MPFLEAIRLALRMIWAQKLKSGFSVIGVFIGVMFLIAVVTVVEGMNTYMKDRFATLLGANTFQLRRYPDFSVGDVSREQWRAWLRHPRITTDDARAVTAALKTPVMTAWESDQRATVEYRGKAANDIRIIGATEDYFDIRSWKIEQGRAFSPQESSAGRPVLVIGKELADRLFEDLDPVGREVKIQGIPYRVVGVVESQGNIFGLSLDKFAVAPALSPVKRFINPPNVIDILLVRAASTEEMQQSMLEVEAIMRSRRGLRPTEDNDFSVETADAILDFWAQITRILFIALPGLVGISLVVGAIVIMNIMLMSVSERTREIGIRKSLGARRRDILRQFLVEAAVLAFLGAAIGIAAGLVLAGIVEAVSPLPAAVAPWSIGVAIVLGCGVGIGAGIYPASRASKLDPVHAMRFE
jgi:putative ABC transport system permease protein